MRVLDPSQLHRPEPAFADKPLSKFRDYTEDDSDPIKYRVKLTYFKMHTFQTVEFVKSRHEKWLKFDMFKAGIMEALYKLNDLVDESDPDVDLPNIVHAFQTAEKIREEHPDQDWFHLVGLIHDLGKVMALYNEPQWAVVGDTFPVGCHWADSIVYRKESFIINQDGDDSRYNTKYGMYSPHCGLENVLMSWGHDEYLYRVLTNHGCSFPEEGLYMIRFHSFYPWHASGDYAHLASDKDLLMLPHVREFNKYDLYTKSETIPDIEALTPYYQSLIDKYIPGEVRW